MQPAWLARACQACAHEQLHAWRPWQPAVRILHDGPLDACSLPALHAHAKPAQFSSCLQAALQVKAPL